MGHDVARFCTKVLLLLARLLAIYLPLVFVRRLLTPDAAFHEWLGIALSIFLAAKAVSYWGALQSSPGWREEVVRFGVFICMAGLADASSIYETVLWFAMISLLVGQHKLSTSKEGGPEETEALPESQNLRQQL